MTVSSVRLKGLRVCLVRVCDLNCMQEYAGVDCLMSVWRTFGKERTCMQVEAAVSHESLGLGFSVSRECKLAAAPWKRR
jgi:hypothetical protein